MATIDLFSALHCHVMHEQEANPPVSNRRVCLNTSSSLDCAWLIWHLYSPTLVLKGEEKTTLQREDQSPRDHKNNQASSYLKRVKRNRWEDQGSYSVFGLCLSLPLVCHEGLGQEPSSGLQMLIRKAHHDENI